MASTLERELVVIDLANLREISRQNIEQIQEIEEPPASINFTSPNFCMESCAAVLCIIGLLGLIIFIIYNATLFLTQIFYSK